MSFILSVGALSLISLVDTCLHREAIIEMHNANNVIQAYQSSKSFLENCNATDQEIAEVFILSSWYSGLRPFINSDISCSSAVVSKAESINYAPLMPLYSCKQVDDFAGGEKKQDGDKVAAGSIGVEKFSEYSPKISNSLVEIMQIEDSFEKESELMKLEQLNPEISLPSSAELTLPDNPKAISKEYTKQPINHQYNVKNIYIGSLNIKRQTNASLTGWLASKRGFQYEYDQLSNMIYLSADSGLTITPYYISSIQDNEEFGLEYPLLSKFRDALLKSFINHQPSVAIIESGFISTLATRLLSIESNNTIKIKVINTEEIQEGLARLISNEQINVSSLGSEILIIGSASFSSLVNAFIKQELTPSPEYGLQTILTTPANRVERRDISNPIYIFSDEIQGCLKFLDNKYSLDNIEEIMDFSNLFILGNSIQQDANGFYLNTYEIGHQKYSLHTISNGQTLCESTAVTNEPETKEETKPEIKTELGSEPIFI